MYLQLNIRKTFTYLFSFTTFQRKHSNSVMCSREGVDVFYCDRAVRLRAFLWPVHLTFAAPSFHQICDHNDNNGALLPNHSPKISEGMWQRSLGCYISMRLAITLKTKTFL